MSSVIHSTVSRSSTISFLLFIISVIFLFQSRAVSAQVHAAPPGRSSFTARLVNIEASAHEQFQYTTSLLNASGQTRIYELDAQLPPGWGATFRARGSQLTSINIESKKEQEISIDFHPAPDVRPGKYKIPVRATAQNDTLVLELEAVIKGSYRMQLTTPNGLLSEQLTEGTKEAIHLVVTNTGTLPLNTISLSAQTPSRWDASFNPSSLSELAPGKSADILVTLTVPDKTLAGDYVSTFKAQEAHVNAEASFRITVRTSLLSGWIGMAFILVAVGMVVYLIRKYGRR